MSLITVMGDVHHHIALAAEGLHRIEAEMGRQIDQVFAVGDLGLFLGEGDWAFLTGPKKYRKPEATPAIRKAWKNWRWPLAMIAGNHEPFNRLRAWDAGYFGGKLTYTDAGELAHGVPGLRVAGLSGIYHPQNEEFVSAIEFRTLKLPRVKSWPEMVELVEGNKISRSRLTYYKEAEVERMKKLDFTPDLLLLHDWPTTPPNVSQIYDRRPENEIVTELRPTFVCCGHHHTAADFVLGRTRVLGLNIISHGANANYRPINDGWAALFEWNGSALSFLSTWPTGTHP
jgi:hypothetical protein